MAERRGFPAGPVVRRAVAQWQLLVAVLVVMVLSGAAVGTGVLLVDVGRRAALHAAAAAADGTAAAGAAGRADLVTVTARTDGAAQDDPPRSRAMVDRLLRGLRTAIGPVDVAESVWVSTPPAHLSGDPVRLAYLLDADTVQQHATIVAGQWPAADAVPQGGATEVVLPSATAGLLGLGVGDLVALRAAGPGADTSLVVVGLVEPDSSGAWDRDRLRGAAADVDSGWLPLYGPLMVAPGTLLAADAPVGRISIEADADLTAPVDDVTAAADRVARLGAALDREVGDQLSSVTVASRLPAFVADARGQLAVTAALVLTTVLLVATLAGAAIALLARLLATRRRADTALLADRGASRAQLAGVAIAEGLVLSVVAVAVAVPLAVAGYRLVTRVGPLADAWSVDGVGPAAPDAEGWLLVGAWVATGTLALAAVGVVLAVRAGSASRPGRHVVAGGVARSGVDVLLVALAVLGVLQLRAHRFDAAGAPDPALVLAPTLALVAVAAVTLRVIAPLARGAE
ncbi:FtsX-like permease family protein, partial [uncultured Cellulomonas sp.]|uniref:FtsX-like permease family protein n=1 Tax=uncultured Cellulomonas sp. TaxID=189682 RepID=UPI0028E37E15